MLLSLAVSALAQEDYSVHPTRRRPAAADDAGAAEPQPDWGTVASSLRARADDVQSKIDALRSHMVPSKAPDDFDSDPGGRKRRADPSIEEETQLVPPQQLQQQQGYGVQQPQQGWLPQAPSQPWQQQQQQQQWQPQQPPQQPQPQWQQQQQQQQQWQQPQQQWQQPQL